MPRKGQREMVCLPSGEIASRIRLHKKRKNYYSIIISNRERERKRDITRFIDDRVFEILVLRYILIASRIVLEESMLRFVLRIRISRVVLLLFRCRVRMLFNQCRLILFSRFPRLRFRDRFRGFTTPRRLDQECVRPLKLRSSPVFAATRAHAPLLKKFEHSRIS